MKRVILSVVCTVVGLVTLLGFKSKTSTTVGGALPSATLSSSSPTTSASPTPAISTSGAPPNTEQSGAAQAMPPQSQAASATPRPSPSASVRKSHAVTAKSQAASKTPALSPSPSRSNTTSKTYDGSAVQTRYGTVQVAVTVVGKQITNVTFLQLTSNDGHSADINSQAAPILLQETLSSQSSHIDSVSGATYTSAGYLQSLQRALDQAGIA